MFIPQHVEKSRINLWFTRWWPLSTDDFLRCWYWGCSANPRAPPEAPPIPQCYWPDRGWPRMTADDRGWPGMTGCFYWCPSCSWMTHKKTHDPMIKIEAHFEYEELHGLDFDLSPKLGACKVSHFADLYYSYHLGGSWATSPYGPGCNRDLTIMLEQL